jgi:hypothetical protein
MQAKDVERIARDVLTTQGLDLSIQRVERLPEGWRVTLLDAADRVIVADLEEADAPAGLRAALMNWSERHL